VRAHTHTPHTHTPHTHTHTHIHTHTHTHTDIHTHGDTQRYKASPTILYSKTTTRNVLKNRHAVLVPIGAYRRTDRLTYLMSQHLPTEYVQRKRRTGEGTDTNRGRERKNTKKKRKKVATHSNLRYYETGGTADYSVLWR